MNFFEKLEKKQTVNESLVCVGLDYDPQKAPKNISIFEFNKAIVDATMDLVSAYKPNIAFYEALGREGLEALYQTVDYIHSIDGLVIADAKRNDIGNTAKAYARGLFDDFGFDATTINPYMGKDSIEPFLEYTEKGVIALVRTSNPGGADFQNLECDGEPLYQKVARKLLEWDKNRNLGFVVGATVPEELQKIREIAPETTFLVPGIGAQGGDIEKTICFGKRADNKGLIINSSRGIIFASNAANFAEAARAETIKLREAINQYR